MFKFCCEDCGECWYVGNPRTCKCPNEELQQPKQEQVKPVPWEQFHEHMAGPNYVAPKRTWIGLTDEDMNNALDYWSDDSRSSYGGAHAANGEYVDMIETWRYIEAKLKEKNT